MGLELLARGGDVAPRLLERLGHLAAGLLARLDRGELELRGACVGLPALLFGRLLDLGEARCQSRLGLLAQPHRRGLHLGEAHRRLLLRLRGHGLGLRRTRLELVVRLRGGGHELGRARLVLLARPRRRRLQVAHPLVGLLAGLLARDLELRHARLRLLGSEAQLREPRLGLLACGGERLLDLVRPATLLPELLLEPVHARRQLGLGDRLPLALGGEPLVGLRARLGELALGGGERLGHRAAGLLMRLRRRLLGGLHARLGLLLRLRRLELERGDARLGLPRDRHERMRGLARPATRAVELLVQLVRPGRQLALQMLALLALVRELLTRTAARHVQRASGLLTRLRQLTRLLGCRLLGRASARASSSWRACADVRSISPDALLELVPRCLQGALGLGCPPPQRLQLGGARRRRARRFLDRGSAAASRVRRSSATRSCRRGSAPAAPRAPSRP